MSTLLSSVVGVISVAEPAWATPWLLALLTLSYVHVGKDSLTGFNRAIGDRYRRYRAKVGMIVPRSSRL
jgi:protein-S-isoprenylcysteine O-methyltransferase Ste14